MKAFGFLIDNTLLLHYTLFRNLTTKGDEVMSAYTRKVEGKNELYFYYSSDTAKRLYYRVLCAGHFLCDNTYHITRDNYDSFLLAYIVNGTFSFADASGNLLTAKENDVVILDCYNRHEYFTNDNVEFLWVHVDGINCRQMYTEIIENGGNIVRCNDFEYTKSLFNRIINAVSCKEAISEAEISLTVYKLFLEMLNPTLYKTAKRGTDDNIRAVIEYMMTHLNETLTVQALAEISHLSVTHFSRLFKQSTGFSPYEYILVLRLNKAKEYLLKTDMTVARIAYEIGFNSEANFVYFFTGKVGVSPGKFRKIKF